jgi:hypothetical protein
MFHKALFRLLIVLAAFSSTANANVAEIFLEPYGSDAADGSTQNRAVATLQRAIDLAAQFDRTQVEKVVIHVGSGIYRGQYVKLDSYHTRIDISIKGAERNGIPVFDGENKPITWFTLNGQTQNGGRLHIEGLQIRSYLTAIAFVGNREEPNRSLGGNIIRHMIFSRIGQSDPKSSLVSTAAIVFVNARNNIVERNKFLDIRNVKTCVKLHSVYLAHHSSNNKIIGNEFNGFCGSPIRLRDGSNNNFAIGNLFLNVGSEALFDEWYCNRSITVGCTKKTPECPSWGNQFFFNIVDEPYFKAASPYVKVHVPINPEGCENGSNQLLRMETHGNRPLSR